MKRTDNRWTIRPTEWQPKDGKQKQGRHRTRQRDEIGSFAGVTWNRQAVDRDKWRWLGEAAAAAAAAADDDDDDDDAADADADDDDDDDDEEEEEEEQDPHHGVQGL